MIRTEIKKIIKDSLAEFEASGEFSLEVPSSSDHGDYASNLAFSVAAKVKKSPMVVAKDFRLKILKTKPRVFKKIEVASPGFLNFFLNPDYFKKQVLKILREKDKYGDLKIGRDKKVQIEFISANPTGPLTIGNARGGFSGDVLGNVLNKAGFRVTKAYYINNYGMQVLMLGHSVLKDDKAKYKGDYIDKLHKTIKGKDPYLVGEKAAKIIIEEIIKKTVFKMEIRFDDWISETWLHQTGRVEKALSLLRKKKLLYEKEGATWFKSSQFGDQRDRVIIKQDGWKTYLAGDAGLHYYKFKEKKFTKVINIWGADHYGDVPGLQAVVEALGYKGRLDILLQQFVTLFENGQELKMSKRAGVYVTMDQLLELVGLDVARFFFLQKSRDTHLNFDVNLAKEQSTKNPVYYIQYAYARICSILAKAGKQKINIAERDLKLLKHKSEILLIKKLASWPEIIEDTSQDYQIQRLPQHALELAASFHQFYRDCQVISEDKDLTKARLSLISAVKIVLKSVLDLIGISAPEKM